MPLEPLDPQEVHVSRTPSVPVDVDQNTVPPDGRPADVQPKWRRDFPIDWSRDEYVSRRDLVKFMVLTSLAFATGQFWILGKSLLDRRTSFPPRLVGRVEELPVGGSKVFEYPKGSAPRLLVRTGERSFVAYDQQCTHLLCPVIPKVNDGTLHCPCHNGLFDLETGRVLAGPPRRPLARIELDIRGPEIYAVGVEERTV
ncbi:MAG TPA: Rieske (2Fe-2S) protein [Rhodothermales bacterium]